MITTSGSFGSRLIATLLAAVGGFAQADAQSKPLEPKATIQVSRLEVRKPIASLQDPAWEHETPVETGVAIDLVCAVKDEMVVDVDAASSRLTQFTDDKGTNFLKAKAGSPAWATDRLRDSPVFSKDGRFALKLASPHLPAAGATKIIVKGKVGCVLGRNAKTEEWTRASKKDDGGYKIGPFAFSIANKDASCQMTHDLPNCIKRISFFDKDERPLKTRLLGTGGSSAYFRFGIFDKDGKSIIESRTEDRRFEWSYNFGPEFAKMKVDYYAAIEKVVVPIDLEISLGL